ncbi:sodium-dependent transporter [Succinimonas amylolytica]|uniref:sodium-dependent transporter n=1 Tax=Succinimonas amylolytica TaxID=83769 RepID=UPI0023A7B6A3
MNLRRFVGNWSLPLAIIAGIISYFAIRFLYRELPAELAVYLPARRTVLAAVAVVQPALIFIMLFISFAKVRFSDLRPPVWTLPLLLVQGGVFSALAGVLYCFPDLKIRILIESAMLAFICPTATAAAVIVRKLSGSAGHVMSYTIFANLLSSALLPAVIPFAHPVPGFSCGSAFVLILAKVVPLLAGPFLLVSVCRRGCPGFLERLCRIPDLAFYFWLISLPLAMAVSVRILAHSPLGSCVILEIAAVSLAACVVQFVLGRVIGGMSGDGMTAGQALGQKSTVFMIWTGYTFFTPVTAITGGFYSIWHNAFNSWQLYRRNREGCSGESQAEGRSSEK